MTVQVNLPDDLVKQIDHAATDRSAADEVERIDAIAEELNREAEDVLEYQVIS